MRRLSKEAITILKILSVKSCYLKQLVMLFQAFDNKIHENYHSLETAVLITTKKLMKKGLIKREGKRLSYLYSITNKGMKKLFHLSFFFYFNLYN